MTGAFTPQLPDLTAYRAELVAAGAPVPLPPVPGQPNGLLAGLPPPPANRTGWPWTLQSPAPDQNLDSYPSITVVMPSYQQAAYLEESIRSVLLQNYPRLCFVIMDGGSRDESPTIIARYRPWLSFARVARDRGQSHAINLGMSLADSDIVAWLNSDDLYLPGTLQRVAAAWRRGADFICGDGLALDQGAQTLRYSLCPHVSARYTKFAGLVIQPSTFWARNIHAPIWEEQHCAMDYELWIRLLPGRRISYLPEPLSLAREHDQAKTYDPAMQKRWEADARRNAQAHPELYRSSVGNRWLTYEQRVVQRLHRWRHGRVLRQRLARLQQTLGWTALTLAA